MSSRDAADVFHGEWTDLLWNVSEYNVCFLFPDEEQQENGHPGEGSERQEEALPGVQAQHRQAGQTGGLRRHQEEVQKGHTTFSLDFG